MPSASKPLAQPVSRKSNRVRPREKRLMPWLRRSLNSITVATARQLRTVLSAVVLVSGLVAAANYAPLLNMHSEQDNCTFGAVSNGQYRAYLSEVQSRQRTKWPAFSRDGQEIDRQLNFRLSDMLRGEATLYERVAIMHAILRAIGAEYPNTNGREEADPFEAASRRRQDVEFNYRVDINRWAFSNRIQGRCGLLPT
jgi:hypothetical protein